MKIILLLIALITIFSGLGQIVMPATILHFIGGDISAANQHSFGIIGMFMVLFGGMVLHTFYEPNTSKTVLIWAALQKLGAGIAVILAIQKGLFNSLAYAVAIFDLLTAGLFYLYIKKTFK